MEGVYIFLTLFLDRDGFRTQRHAGERYHRNVSPLCQTVGIEYSTIILPRVWISSDDVAAVAAKGFRIVHGPSDFFYLDCGAGEWVGVDIGLVHYSIF